MNLLFQMVKAAVAVGGLAAMTLSAHAQSASVGHQVVVSVPGGKAAHADQINASIEDGNLNVSGGVADGARVGDTTGQVGVNGKISVPVPTPSRPVPVPTPEQAAAPIVAPVVIAKKIFRHW